MTCGLGLRSGRERERDPGQDGGHRGVRGVQCGPGAADLGGRAEGGRSACREERPGMDILDRSLIDP